MFTTIGDRMRPTFLVLTALVMPLAAHADPIPLGELRARGVRGALGEPFGKIVVVSGVVVDGESLHTKEASDGTYLRVSKVGERDLPSPVLVRVAFKSTPAMPRLPVGKTIRCAGFETGFYRGAVPHEFDYVEAYATSSYGFHNEWILLKVL